MKMRVHEWCLCALVSLGCGGEVSEVDELAEASQNLGTCGTTPCAGATSGTVFADATGTPLTQVTIRSGWWIDAIQGVRSSGPLARHGGGGGTQAIATWPAEEYLVQVKGKYGNHVGQLSFVTNTGRVVGPFGSALGGAGTTPFELVAPAGHAIVGFAGRAGTALQALGLVTAPVPEATLDLAKGKPISADSENQGYVAANAVDGKAGTKWEGKPTGSDHWLRVDLLGSTRVARWVVKHTDFVPGGAGTNTRDFRLQRSDDGEGWTDVDVVTDNNASLTDRNVTPFSARFVRLLITKPAQSAGDLYARVLDFELYAVAAPPDRTAPSLSGELTVDEVTATTARVSWPAGKDENTGGVESYDLVANGLALGTRETKAGAVGLRCGTTQRIEVRARDWAGNVSSPLTASFTTSACGAPIAMEPGMNLYVQTWGTNAPANYFRPNLDWSTVTDPWNPQFLADLRATRTKVLRFMDWNAVNSTSVKDWSERVPKTVNQATAKLPRFTWSPAHDGTVVLGTETMPAVALEWQIDLANRTGSDLWINVPVRASPDYVTQLARLLKTTLNPARKIYLEWGNEIWNTGSAFRATAWARMEGRAAGLQSISVPYYPTLERRYTVYASVRTFELFEAEFGRNSPRLVKLIAGQHGMSFPGLDKNPMISGDLELLRHPTINPRGTTIDAYAIAPYFDGHRPETARNAIGNSLLGVLRARQSLAGTGIRLIAYESGGDTGGEAPSLPLTRDPRQEALYVDYLNAMAPYFSGPLNQYTLYGGSWGLKDSASDDLSISPKYRGWVAFWSAH